METKVSPTPKPVLSHCSTPGCQQEGVWTGGPATLLCMVPVQERDGVCLQRQDPRAVKDEDKRIDASSAMAGSPDGEMWCPTRKDRMEVMNGKSHACSLGP